MTTKKLSESGTIIESAKADDGVFSVRIIDEGQGSSGYYSRELLQEHGPRTFTKGVKMFMNHPTGNPWDRSITDLAGKFLEDAHYKEVDGVGGLYTTVRVDERWRGFIREYADVIGVSIYVEGEGEERDGVYHVTGFNQNDAYKAADWVIAPGRGGGIVERAMESYRAIETSATAEPGSAPAASRTEKKENLLDPKDFEERMARIEESLAALLPAVTALVESLKPAEKPDVDVAAAAVEADRKATEAGIPVELRTAIVEAAKSGGDVEAALTESKRVVESVKAGILAEAESEGRFGGAAGVTDASTILPKGW